MTATTEQARPGVEFRSPAMKVTCFVKINEALKWNYLSLHPGNKNTKSETHQVQSRQVAELFVCDVGYKCGSQGHNRNQVKCEADNSIKSVESPSSGSNTTVNTDENCSIVSDGVFSPGNIFVTWHGTVWSS